MNAPRGEEGSSSGSRVGLVILRGKKKSQFGGEEKRPGQGLRWVGLWMDKLEWRARPDNPFPCFAHIGEMG